MVFSPAVVALQVAPQVLCWDQVVLPKPRGAHRDLVALTESESWF